MLRLVPILLFLPGCGLIAGLRTDYELGEAGTSDAGGDPGWDAGSEAGDAGSGAESGCANMTRDGLETDTDCGGGICPKCGNNKTCADASDCASNNCNTSGKCRP